MKTLLLLLLLLLSIFATIISDRQRARWQKLCYEQSAALTNRNKITITNEVQLREFVNNLAVGMMPVNPRYSWNLAAVQVAEADGWASELMEFTAERVLKSTNSPFAVFPLGNLTNVWPAKPAPPRLRGASVL